MKQALVNEIAGLPSGSLKIIVSQRNKKTGSSREAVISGWNGDDLKALVSELESVKAEKEKLRTALVNLLDCLDQVGEDTQGVFAMAAIHHMPYKGRNWVKEYEAGREALAALEAVRDEKPSQFRDAIKKLDESISPGVVICRGLDEKEK